MWTVIYVAHQEEDAQRVQDKLNSEGFLVKVKKIGKMDDAIFELLVPECEADEAHGVINNEY
ncbi:glutamate decarboxylase [Wukongibacter sp. M2B1]|uniref:glutamate decarboxylase n=1 Tax=Wukongibacter sp. M2B1 TaxID=3088895 RepID=UPI003D79EBB7